MAKTKNGISIINHVVCFSSASCSFHCFCSRQKLYPIHIFCYTRIKTNHPMFLWHINEMRLCRFSAGSLLSSSMFTVMRWKRSLSTALSAMILYHQIFSSLCIAGEPSSSARSLRSARRWQHLQHGKGPASYVRQVRFLCLISWD